MGIKGPLIAGIELGGTKCIALLGTGPADVRAQLTIPTTDPEATLAAIEAALDGWAFDAIGVASFGPLQLDPAAADYGAITATTKPGWTGTDLVRRLEGRYAKPIGFQTDVNGAALAEGRWGAAVTTRLWSSPPRSWTNRSHCGPSCGNSAPGQPKRSASAGPEISPSTQSPWKRHQPA